MTPALAMQIAAAYARHEKDAGGIANADLKACVARTAAECGITYEEARDALRAHWAGPMGAG